jgi:predicted transcriptional regulator
MAAIDKELTGYLSHLTLSQKKSLLAVIKSFLSKEEVSDIDTVQYNNEIDEAMARMDSGKFISHDELEKEAAGW